jgi:DNA-binding NarL/FixJ family response regulator
LDPVLQAGARGVVVKSAHPASLLQAIRSVSQGLKWLDPEIREKLADPDSILPNQRERWESLSKRERQIAELVLQGLRYKDIAASLHISGHTVRNHLRNVFTKLRITSRVELAPYASETVSI